MPRIVAVIGAGPVGCLMALSLAKQGWVVQLYDARSEASLLGEEKREAARSINLAISARGIAAMEAVDAQLARSSLRDMIPMRGRFIHASDGSESRQAYDAKGQCINSVDRGLLNATLVQEAIRNPAIELFFQHKLITADFDKRSILFEVLSAHGGSRQKPVDFDFCVGADGSYSNTRRQLMRVVRMDFQQQYIPHDYLELHIPAGKGANGESIFLLDPDYLHIWPRHSFMLIALPNKDKTFTCTLFAPTEELGRLVNHAAALTWFKIYFPDAVRLIGETRLLNDFHANPRGALICTKVSYDHASWYMWDDVIKAKPYHYKDRAIIIGDAAHSMVPFYGQGLNCGLEDVRVLDSLFSKHCVEPRTSVERDGCDDRLADALREYSDSRYADLIAITDLAMENYIEMRHSVTTLSYRLHKFVDAVLSKFTSHRPKKIARSALHGESFPSAWAGGWLPLYTMVTFRSDMSYSSVRYQANWQMITLKSALWVLSLGTTGGLLRRFVTMNRKVVH